ncbi:MAG: hypothetical protein JW937_07445 [Candidatus Omnitrophica bacterium]|nr:hypothetical protein [Candidatus Omnitrophota bacterium]
MNLSKLSSRERWVLGISALVVFVWFSDQVVLRYWGSYSQSLGSQVQDLQVELERNEKLLVRRPFIEADVKAYEGFIRNRDSGEMELARLIDTVEKYGAQSNISFKEIKPLDPVEENDYYQSGIEVRYEGALTDWIKFLHLVLTSEVLLEVQKAEIAPIDDTRDKVEGYVRITSLALGPSGAGEGVDE